MFAASTLLVRGPGPKALIPMDLQKVRAPDVEVTLSSKYMEHHGTLRNV